MSIADMNDRMYIKRWLVVVVAYLPPELGHVSPLWFWIKSVLKLPQLSLLRLLPPYLDSSSLFPIRHHHTGSVNHINMLLSGPLPSSQSHAI